MFHRVVNISQKYKKEREESIIIITEYYFLEFRKNKQTHEDI